MVNRLEYPFNHSIIESGSCVWLLVLNWYINVFVNRCLSFLFWFFKFYFFENHFSNPTIYHFQTNKQATKQVWNVKKTTTIIDVGRIRLRLYPYHHQAWLFRFSFIFSIQKYERIYWTTAAAHVHYPYSIEEEENLSRKKVYRFFFFVVFSNWHTLSVCLCASALKIVNYDDDDDDDGWIVKRETKEKI